MDIGLLWFDKGSEQLSHKVQRAAKRYKERFGQQANVCYVHPEALPEGSQKVGKIWLRTSSRVLRHHLWVGYEHPQER